MGACGWGDWDRVLMNCDQFGQAFWPAHGTVDCSRMKKLIAIVEDEPAIRANYAAAFERNGYVVRAFANRRLAMQAFNSRLPDLAIWRGLGPATPPDLGPLLPPGSLLLSFVLDDEDLLVLASAPVSAPARKTNTHADRISGGSIVARTSNGNGSQRTSSLHESRAQFEREFILSKLRENNWNISQTARLLGLERSYLYRKMKAYNIEK